MLNRFFRVTALPPYVDFAIFFLRVGMAILMLPHGFKKLQKILNGEFGFSDPIGMGQGFSLISATFAELGCSLLLLFGLFTRPALSILIFTLFVITFVVKISEGFDGMEKGLLFLIPYISLFMWGPGRYSLDYYIFGRTRRSVRF